MLFIGEPLKEYIATVEPGGTLSHASFTGFAGDLAPNMASYTRMAATRFGVACTIDVLTAVGPLGDPSSDGMLADLTSRGLGIHSYSKRLPATALGIVINLKNPDGSPSADKVRLVRSDSPFRDLLTDATDEDLVAITRGYAHIVISGTSLACVRDRGKLVAILRKAKCRDPAPQVILSTNLRPSNWQMPDRDHPAGLSPQDDEWRRKARRWLDDVIGLADIICANFTDECTLRGSGTPVEAAETLRRLSDGAEVIVTNDAEPIVAVYGSRDAGATVMLPVHPVAAVIDTVGAGDAFAGTYLAARMAGHDVPAAAEWGLAIAAQVVGFDGALPRDGRSLVFGAGARS